MKELEPKRWVFEADRVHMERDGQKNEKDEEIRRKEPKTSEGP